MVIAYHLIWTAYGTWLPNDPRGSGSRTVISDSLAKLGELHFGRKRVQPPSKAVCDFYRRAESLLRFPVFRFTAEQIQSIACGLAAAIAEHRYTCYGCAILPDHVHILIRKHKYRAEQMIDHLQSASRLRFSDFPGIPPAHPIWTDGGWKRFLDSPATVGAVIRYVEQNPVKSKLERFHFMCVGSRSVESSFGTRVR